MLRMWYNYDITLLQKGLFNKIISREKKMKIFIYSMYSITFSRYFIWFHKAYFMAVVPQVSDVVHVPLDNIYNASVRNY